MATPPQGYQLDPAALDTSTVADFIKRHVNVGAVEQSGQPRSKIQLPAAAGYHTIAESTPGKISVFSPGEYTPEVRNHEMTHQLQQVNDVGGVKLPGGYVLDLPGQVKPYTGSAGGKMSGYRYGGVDGLLAARQAGKTVADFNQEQQADMVADYQEMQRDYMEKARAGKTTPQDAALMRRVYAAYHPFVQQLADVPQYSLKRALATLIGVTLPEAPAAPRAPGLPGYGTAGLPDRPDPLLEASAP